MKVEVTGAYRFKPEINGVITQFTFLKVSSEINGVIMQLKISSHR